MKSFIYEEGGAFVFKMPADGVVFWDTERYALSLYPEYSSLAGLYEHKEEAEVGAKYFWKGEVVVLYIHHRADINDFYIDFVN